MEEHTRPSVADLRENRRKTLSPVRKNGMG
jgi:hypothetical protein